jgi:hypothetical protein
MVCYIEGRIEIEGIFEEVLQRTMGSKNEMV